MERDDTSSQIVTPTISARELQTRASSGSGTLISESGLTPIGSPSPQTRQAGLLKNSSGRAAAYTRA
jgi:hypothetical protein